MGWLHQFDQLHCPGRLQRGGMVGSDSGLFQNPRCAEGPGVVINGANLYMETRVVMLGIPVMVVHTYS